MKVNKMGVGRIPRKAKKAMGGNPFPRKATERELSAPIRNEDFRK